MAGKPKKRHPVTQPLNQSYRFIALTRNQNAIVDAIDFAWLNQFNWTAQWCEHTKSFYAMRGRHGIAMHRVILDCKPGEIGDHKNHNTLDNRRQNLRKCTSSQNATNRRKRANTTSIYKGVSWYKNSHKWMAYARIEHKIKNLGYFNDPKDAARAYDEAAKKYYGEFTELNFPKHHSSKSSHQEPRAAQEEYS